MLPTAKGTAPRRIAGRKGLRPVSSTKPLLGLEFERPETLTRRGPFSTVSSATFRESVGPSTPRPPKLCQEDAAPADGEAGEAGDADFRPLSRGGFGGMRKSAG